MTTTAPRGADDGLGSSSVDPETAYSWVGFAAIILALGGIWNIFEGTAALFSSKVYVADAAYVFGDLRTWGWIVLALGIAELFAAASLFKGGQLARWFAIFVVGLNAIGQLLFIESRPLWSLAMFALDVLVLYALAVYGGVARSSD